MPQFKNQLITRRLRKVRALDALLSIVSRLEAVEKKLETRVEKQPNRQRVGRGTVITRDHEQAVLDLIKNGTSRRLAASQLGISRTAASLLAAGKYPFSQPINEAA